MSAADASAGRVDSERMATGAAVFAVGSDRGQRDGDRRGDGIAPRCNRGFLGAPEATGLGGAVPGSLFEPGFA